MEKTLHLINKMQKEGLFEKYAIGGGIATLFYIEPVATFDLDIFIILSDETESLVSLSHLYQWLQKYLKQKINFIKIKLNYPLRKK